MNARNIQVGDILQLKAERAEVYGCPQDDIITCASIRTQGAYKTPWIIAPNGDAYRASDFKRKLG